MDIKTVEWVLPHEHLEKIKNLPSLPATIDKILSYMERDTISINKLEEIIAQDPSVTNKLLTYINSSGRDKSAPIQDIRKAISIIGFKAIKSLILGLSLNDIIVTNFSCEFFNPKSFWLHSMGVGLASRYLCEILNEPNEEDFFTAGLLHDIGILIMFMYFNKETHEIIRIKKEKNIDFHEAENLYILKIKHTDVGVFMAKKWKLSDFHINMIKYHHNPLDATEFEHKASIIFLAEQICEKLRLGWNFNNDNNLLIPKNLKVEKNQIIKLLEIMKEEKKMLEEIWKISFEKI